VSCWHPVIPIRNPFRADQCGATHRALGMILHPPATS
jgi:hypothetical protein